MVGAAVAASMLGVVLPGTDARPAPRPRIRLSAIQHATVPPDAARLRLSDLQRKAHP